ncbi:Mitochondrial fission protein [Coemansia sp. Benny D115]|nr:Mitochondrial fission protein [Coemansia sp. Benny D115]
MRRASSSNAAAGQDDQLDYDPSGSQGVLAWLVTKLLQRNGLQSTMGRLLRRSSRSLDGRDMQSKLLTSGQRQSRSSKKQAPALSADALLANAPALGSAPSLLAGFNAFLQSEHRQKSEDRHSSHGSPERSAIEEEEGVAPLGMTASEFDTMLRRTPHDILGEVLAERKDEYGEYLRRLEAARSRLVQRLGKLDERILAAVAERQAVEQRLERVEKDDEAHAKKESGSAANEPAAVPGRATGIEDVSDDNDNDFNDDAGSDQDDAPRLRRLERVLRGHYGAVTALASDPALGLVASGSLDTHVRVWDADSGQCRHIIRGHSDVVRGVQFHDRFLVTAANDGRLRMWDLALLDSVQPQPASPVLREAYVPMHRRTHSSEDSEMVMSSLTPPVTPTICRHVPPLELCCENTFIGHTDAVTCFQAAETTLISGSADHTVREWDLSTGQARQTIDLAWAIGSSDRASAVSAGRRRAINDDAAAARRGTDAGDGGYIGALQFYEFALATGTADGVLRLWDLRTAQPHRHLAGHTRPITSLRFNDRWVMTGALDGAAVLWDLRTGGVLQRWTVDSGCVSSVQLTRSAGQEFAAACWVAANDHMLHWFNAASMQHMRYATDYGRMDSTRSRMASTRLSDGTAAVTRLHYDADAPAPMLLSGDSEGIVKIWTV